MELEPCVLTKQFVLKQHKLFKQIDILFPTYNRPLSSVSEIQCLLRIKKSLKILCEGRI